MLHSRFVAVVTAFASVAVLTACGGSSGTTPVAGPASGSSTVSSTSSSTTSSTSAPTGSPSDPASGTGPSFVSGGSALADDGHLIYVLEAVNPEIGTNKDDLIAKSKTLCSHINANESEDQLETNASKLFKNGSWVASEPEAQAFVGTVKAYANC